EEAHRYPWVMDLTGSPPRDRPDGARPASARAAADRNRAA
ncbi:MAG: fatty acid hydroxylase family protein, partial [Gluconobacter oxydans]